MTKEELNKFEEDILGTSDGDYVTKIPPVQNVPPESLSVDGKNPNRMSEAQFDSLKAGIRKFGFIVPVITNKDFVVCDGEHRLKAAKEIGFDEIPVVALPVSEVDRRMLRQVLNKLKGTHDLLLDKEEFKFIFDKGGFDEYQKLIGDSDVSLIKFLAEKEKAEAKDDGFDVDSALKKNKYDVKLGDVYKLGDHRLVCGDATNSDDLAVLMDEEVADMVFTDPPYNVAYDQDKSPQGKPKNSKGSMQNDAMTREEFKEFLTKSLSNLMVACDGAFYICMSCKEWAPLMTIFELLGGHWSSTIIWNKSNFVMGRSDYHRKFEPILYGWKEGKQHYFVPDRTQSDVWDFNKPMSNKLHPTMKPVELVAKAVSNSSKEGHKILDLFGGSGTTLIASEQLKRKCYIMELDPRFCSVIIERWETLTGKKATKETQ